MTHVEALVARWRDEHPELADPAVAPLADAFLQRATLAATLALKRGGPEVQRSRAARAALAGQVEQIKATGVDVAPLEAAIAEREEAYCLAILWTAASALSDAGMPGGGFTSGEVQ